jgi:recombination protein RecA
VKTFLKENPDMAERIERAIRQSAGLVAEQMLEGEMHEGDADDGEPPIEEETVTSISGGGRKSKRG